MDNLDSLLTTVNELKVSLAAIAEKTGQKGEQVHADAIKRDELDKMKTDIISEFEKKFAESKAVKEEPKKEGIIKLSDFMLGAKRNHPSVEKYFMKTSMSEGTPAQGGYTVPVEYSDMIVGELNNPSFVVNRFTPLVHNEGYIKYIPKWLTDLTVYWVDEEALKTQSKPTVQRITSTLKKICALIAATDEYIQDDITGMEGHLAKLVAQNIEIELERLAFIGTTVGGDAFNGVFQSAPNSNDQLGANLAYADIVTLLNDTGMNEMHRQGAEMFMNRTMLGRIMGLVDLQGRPMWSLQLGSNGQLQNTILGIPITVCTAITDTCSTLGAKSVIFYGNPNNIMLGRKAGQEGIQLLTSQHGVIGNAQGAITTNAYQMDETLYRFVMRRSVVIPVGEAWTVIDEAK